MALSVGRGGGMTRTAVSVRLIAGVHIHEGNANDVGTMDALVRLVPESALVIVYLDPQGVDLHMDTIRALAWRFTCLPPRAASDIVRPKGAL